MTDLDKLIADVEAGTISGKTPHANLPCKALDLLGAYAGSLDAALRLHEALLPERYVATITHSKRYGAKAIILDPMDGEQWVSSEDWNDNPARAWLLAILRALKAKGDA